VYFPMYFYLEHLAYFYLEHLILAQGTMSRPAVDVYLTCPHCVRMSAKQLEMAVSSLPNRQVDIAGNDNTANTCNTANTASTCNAASTASTCNAASRSENNSSNSSKNNSSSDPWQLSLITSYNLLSFSSAEPICIFYLPKSQLRRAVDIGRFWYSYVSDNVDFAFSPNFDVTENPKGFPFINLVQKTALNGIPYEKMPDLVRIGVSRFLTR
jgi:hypothetical protein